MFVLRKHIRSLQVNIFCLVCIFALLASCSGADTPLIDSALSPRKQSTVIEYPKAEVTFETQTLGELPAEQNLYVEFLDEVTGLGLNPARVKMEKKDPKTFTLKIPVVAGAVIKYRFWRDNDPFSIEYTRPDKQVRYRLAFVDGPIIIRETIAGWKTTPLSGGTGRIQGKVALKGSNSPVINAMVAAGGLQTITASDGSFLLEELPVGMHNLVVYSLDGSFQPFQQGAVVATESTTPAQIQVNPVKIVNVTFIANPPDDNIKGIPVRMVGNILALGNTFADMSGGVSIVASRAPLMAILPDGRYSLTLKLPAGLDLRYKYTLGDGFWNTEQAANGETRLRQFIVPEKDSSVEDVIDTWNTTDRAPITFTVTVPGSTPVTDRISIQFNPFTWTEPIPMWPAGNNRWFYILYNPFDTVREGTYRFCRNDQCGTADSIDSRGPSAPGFPFKPQTADQNYDNSVDAWAWTDKTSDPVIVPAIEIKPRDSGYITGVELISDYDPTWLSTMNNAFQNLKDIGAGTAILTPTWSVTHNSPPVFETAPGKDALWTDLNQMVVQAQQKGLAVAVHPTLRYPGEPGDWWAAAPRDDNWWQSWFDRYHTFILHHADLAAQTGVKTLVIGDDSLFPALPGGKLTNGQPSKVPGDAGLRWRKIITDVRARYTGKLAWFIPYSGKLPFIPGFLSEFDLVYVQINAPVGADGSSQEDLETSIAAIIDGDIQKIQEKTGKPIVIGLKFPSVQGAIDGCVGVPDACLPINGFDQPAVELPGAELALNQQAQVYAAMLSVISQRSWIGGFYSAGYYPPVGLVDMSNSIHGKPASDVLWFWYPRLTGVITQ